MRAIKFRGKSLDNGEWVYGDLVHITTQEGVKGALIIHDTQVVGEPTSDEAVLSYDRNEVSVVIPSTVGQSTGVLDYEGREVYDGDIVESITASEFKAKENIPWEWEAGEYTIDHYVVMWDKSYNDFGFTFLGNKANLNWLNLKYFRVIGNIHDNPELMEL